MQPTEKQLLHWKELYGTIHSMELENQPIYFRSLTPWEIQAFQELEAALPQKDWYHAICRKAVLFPEEFEFQLAGTEYALGNAILDASLPIDEQGNFMIDEYRQWAQKISKENAAFALAVAIANHYPSIDLMKLLNTPMEQLMRLAALVEIIIGQNIFQGTPEGQDPHAQRLRAVIEAEKRRMKRS